MIAAQLLAYYFTELKDDQLKKVSVSSTTQLNHRLQGGQPPTPVHIRQHIHTEPSEGVSWLEERDGDFQSKKRSRA